MTETRTVTILGRDIAVTQLNETQFMLMTREVQRVQRVVKTDAPIPKEDVTGILTSMSRILNILETRVVDQDDRDWLTDRMSDGDISVFDILPIIRAFYDEDDEPVKPKVSRARPVRRR